MARTAGMYGRLAPDPEKPRLTLERYLDPRAPMKRGGLPAVPLSKDVDRASKVKSWPMYCNDSVGCCTEAAMGHMYGAWTTYAAGSEALFDDNGILTPYSRVSGYVPGQPDTDAGAQMQDVLADQKANGMTDTAGKVHTVVGYAAFGNPQDLDLLGQVLDVFGTVYVGIEVQQQMESEFADQSPWTWEADGEVIGGHAVCLQRRLGRGRAPFEYVTWGALQEATKGFQAYAVEEAWAVVTQDWIDDKNVTVEGLDLDQLLSDMQYV